MNVGELKDLLKELPDDALVIVEGNHGTCSVAKAKNGFSTKPNYMGFCDWIHSCDGFRRTQWESIPAVFIYSEE